MDLSKKSGSNCVFLPLSTYPSVLLISAAFAGHRTWLLIKITFPQPHTLSILVLAQMKFFKSSAKSRCASAKGWLSQPVISLTVSVGILTFQIQGNALPMLQFINELYLRLIIGTDKFCFIFRNPGFGIKRFDHFR